jgi:hypothetical protein
VCAEADQAVARVAKTAMFESGRDGSATISQEAWLITPAASKTDLAKALAYEAACRSASPQSEQEVIIKNEFGQVLLRRFVRVAPELPAFK